MFCLLLGAYLATASFRIDTIDTAVRLEVARALVREGTPAIRPLEMSTPFGVVGSFEGRDGRHYAVYGLAQSLLMAPLVALGGAHDAQLVTLINPAATALTGALLVLIGARLGFGARASAGTALVFGLATLAWPHARLTFEAPLEMAAGTAALFFALRPDPRGAALAGAALSFALLVRPTAVVALPAVAWLLGAAAGPSRRRVALAFLAGAAPLVAVALLYNVLRWGSPLATGYSHTGYRYFALQWEGLVGLLASPGRSFFLFSPILALAPWGWLELRRRRPRFAVAALLLAGGYLVFLSFVTVWNGDWTWGPRHLLPVVPAVSLLLLPLLEPGRVRAALLAPLIAVSFAVQLVGVMVSYECYFLWHNQWMRDTGIRERAGADHFHASRSQIWVELRIAMTFLGSLGERIASFDAETDRSPYSSILDGAPPVTVRVPDVAWVYLPMIRAPARLVAGLAAVCILLVGAGLLGLRRGAGEAA
ncbi:MAG: hypothetical protein ACT4PE_03565 [Candidatus Eiseniibacteriota bacterium]